MNPAMVVVRVACALLQPSSPTCPHHHVASRTSPEPPLPRRGPARPHGPRPSHLARPQGPVLSGKDGVSASLCIDLFTGKVPMVPHAGFGVRPPAAPLTAPCSSAAPRGFSLHAVF